MNALDYLLKANLYGLLFVSCYWLLLRRHTFFGLNRTYLLASVALSLVLPVVSLPTETAETLAVSVGVITLPTMTVTAMPTETAPAWPDWEQIGAWAYGLVAAALLTRLLMRTRRLLDFIRRSPRQTHNRYVLVQPNDSTIPTFSFFRYLVLNPADADNNLILRHELVHIRQRHSTDVLALAVLRAVFWACPTLWLIDRALRQVHEFLADQVASVQEVIPPAGYAQFLVEYTFGVRPDALANGFFNPSLLKRRIQMLHQRATSRWALGKYVLVLPLLLCLLAMTTAREQVAAVMTPIIKKDTITVSGRVISATNGKPLPGANIVVKGTSKGTTSNAEGRYTLGGLSSDAFIVVSFVGFKPTEIRLNGRTAVDIRLEQQPNRLNELSVIGYGATDQPTKPVNAASQPAATTTATGEVFTVVEQQPEFPGGSSALSQYLQRNLRYPAKAQREYVTGTVAVRFTVTADGSIDDVFVEKGIGGGCNEEATRLISQMPRWKPGYQNGRAVDVQYVLPIEFSLEDKRTGQTEPVFKPVGTPTGALPTMRSTNFPYQPMLRQQTVTIRGTGPLGSLGEEPLYIVDGQETTADSAKTLSHERIESVTVLKETASTASYGGKGKHGVVIITTKKQ